MRVLIGGDFKYARAGGVTNYVQSLLEHFDRKKIVPFDYTLQENQKIATVRQRSFALNIYRRVKALYSISVFMPILKKGQIDLIHLNPSLCSAAVHRDIWFARKAYKAGVPFIACFHGWDKNYERKLEKSRLLRKFVEIFGNADRVLVLASEFRNKLLDWGFDTKRVQVETTMFDDCLLDGFDISKKLNHIDNQSTFRLLFLSRLVPEKGLFETVDAYNLLRKKGANVTLTIAGDGQEKNKCQKYVNDKGIPGVFFPGFVLGEEKSNVFAQADLLLFPTYGEGFPVTVLEAMAFGLPVISRPVGGLVDFFQNGKMGFLTESKSPDVLAALCETLIQDCGMRKQIGLFNHEYAMKHFLASEVTLRIEAIYAEVIEAHG